MSQVCTYYVHTCDIVREVRGTARPGALCCRSRPVWSPWSFQEERVCFLFDDAVQRTSIWILH